MDTNSISQTTQDVNLVKELFGYRVHDLRESDQSDLRHGDYTIHDYGRGLEVGQVRNGHIFGVSEPPFPVNWREMVENDTEYMANVQLNESDYF